MSDEREREEEERGFKVEDRRRFTDDAQASDTPEPASAPEAPEVPEQAAAEQPAADRDAENSAAEDAYAAQDPGPGPGPGEINFSSFAVGLGTQALMYLGVAPDPTSGLVAKDLAQARALIDILGMLAEKTQGNLDEDEDKMLGDMLYELRMLYVREAQGDAPSQE